MQTTLIVLTVLISILLIGIILIQKSKGGGLASNFAGSNQIMGVRRTNDFIEKATWTLATVIGLLAIISSILMPKAGSDHQFDTKPYETTQSADFGTNTDAAKADAQQAPAQEASAAAAPAQEASAAAAAK